MHSRRSPLLKAAFFALGLSLLGLPLISRAGIFSDYRVELSSHAASTATNQEIEFVTRQGFTVAAHTLAIRYESGFDISGVTFADMDLAVDNDTTCDGPWTDKTLESGASPSADAWGVAVSGQTITLTSSASATADIATDRCVQIQIGTNAASGTNRIVNPGAAGSYDISVIRGRDTGEDGEQGMAAVAIASVPTVTVSATVSSAGGSPAPASPSPAPSDTTAPIISNIAVSSITATSASVTWQTNEAASTVFSYGTTTAYEIGSMPDALFRTSHTRSLTGLSSGTEHHFQIQATDSSGNASLSPDTTFTTLDVTSPTITNIQVINITESSATVTWLTNEPATSAVAAISDPAISTTSSLLVMAHSLTLTALDDNMTYPVTVTSADASGNSTSANTSFTTLEDVSPTNVTNLVGVPGIEQIVLGWRNPSDSDLAGVQVRFSLTAPPSSAFEGTLIFNGLAETYTHTGLTPGVRYYYTVFAYDVAGNLASGAVASAIPLDDDDHIEEEEDAASDDDDHADDADADSTPTDSASDSATPTGSGPTVTPSAPTDSTGSPAIPVSPTDSTGGGPSVPSASTDSTGGGPADADLPPTTVDDSDLLPVSDVSFFVARDTITLTPRSGQLAVLGARPLTVELSMTNVVGTIDRVELLVGSSRYLMNPDSTLVADRTSVLTPVDMSRYRAGVQTPRTNTSMGIVISYMDGRVQTIPFTLSVQGDGRVISSDADVPLESPRVTLLLGATPFDAVAFGQSNPIVAESGSFAWYVPNGTYRVEVTASDFAPLTSASLRTNDNIVNPVLSITPSLLPLEEELARTLSEADGALETVGAISRVFVNRGVQSVKIVRQDANVQQAAIVAAPVATAVAATTAVSLATSFSLIRFLHYLVTAPFLLFNRRRRKQWGVVYDSLRKLPVDLAIVRLHDRATNRIVKSQVTDSHGRYLFMVEPGRYQMSVSKPGFTFPTDHLKEQKRDGEFLDLYHGEDVNVIESGSAIVVAIPLDPEGVKERPPVRVTLQRIGRVAQYAISIAGLVVAAVVVVIQPSVWTIVVLALQVVVLALFVRLARPKKPTGWGIVYDQATRRPLARAIVRIFEPRFNKLLESKVTDGQGRYAFLVGPAEYYATYQKPAYKTVEVRPIDRTDTKEPTYISLNVGLERGRNVTTVEGPSASSGESSDSTHDVQS